MTLKFAPLIRVSTEPQKIWGESLKLQRAQLESAIKSLGAEVPKWPEGWYGGSESATPGKERRELARLVNDAIMGKVNAVMVSEASRWSRDNQKSEEFISLFKEKGIRFFVLSREVDLFDPDQTNVLGIQVHLGQWHAEVMSRRSILSRIARAKRNCPSCGKLPFGRLWDKKTETWSIDKDKHKLVEKMAELYLRDHSFPDLARKFDLSMSHIRSILTRIAGGIWTQEFNYAKFNIHEKVETKIPPLLPDSVIKQIRLKSEGRRLWDRVTIKNEYLLNRLMFDKETGRALTGTTRRDVTYYRRYNGPGYYGINAHAIEQLVLEDLFSMLGSSQAMTKAVWQRDDSGKAMDDLKKERASLQAKINRIKNNFKNLASSIADFRGKGFDQFLGSIKQQVLKQEENLKDWEDRIKEIDRQLAMMPDEETIKIAQKKIQDYAKILMQNQLKKQVKRSYESTLLSLERFQELSYSQKKEFLALLLGGKDSKGKRYGVYIQPHKRQGKAQGFEYEIHGRLGEMEGKIAEEAVSILKGKEIKKVVSFGICQKQDALLCLLYSDP